LKIHLDFDLPHLAARPQFFRLTGKQREWKLDLGVLSEDDSWRRSPQEQPRTQTKKLPGGQPLPTSRLQGRNAERAFFLPGHRAKGNCRGSWQEPPHTLTLHLQFLHISVSLYNFTVRSSNCAFEISTIIHHVSIYLRLFLNSQLHSPFPLPTDFKAILNLCILGACCGEHTNHI
jgi:hypothetical protein